MWFPFDFYYSLMSLLPLVVENVIKLPAVIKVGFWGEPKTQVKRKKFNFLVGQMLTKKIYSL